jgi:FkbM family methyltransferase
MPELTAHLALWPNQTAINACVDEVTGYQRTFHRANNHQSSSLLELGTHKEQAPDVHYVDEFPVITTKVDDLIFEYGVNANFLNMDLQGAELLALFGAEGFLTHADYIYSEVNWEPLYKECAIIHDMDEWLFDHGFTRYDTMMAGNSGWGDALWARPEALGL